MRYEQRLKRTLVVPTVAGLSAAVWLGRSKEDRVVGMGLDVFLEILRAFEGLPAKVAFVRLEWHVNADVGCDMISLHRGSTTATPLASEI
jgi:hypothetical protein